MDKQPKWLLDYKKDVYSQCGEDGVIEKILDYIPENDKWCVEFGAWDGIHLSNVRSLIEKHNYSAVLIEGEIKRYNALRSNYVDNSKVHSVNCYVGTSIDDNLDKVLSNSDIPKDFDFLSIDIDGNDYHIWAAMEMFDPKVVCIEFNPTIPTEVSFIQEADATVNQGSSLLSIVELGKEKGYELISVLPWNAIFVKQEYFHLFEIEDNSPLSLRSSTELVTYIFSGFDGKILLAGAKKLSWHNMNFCEKDVQVLPKVLCQAPFNYGLFRKIFLYLYRKIKNT